VKFNRRWAPRAAVGTLTAVAPVLIIGKAERFGSGKHVVSYLGMAELRYPVGRHPIVT